MTQRQSPQATRSLDVELDIVIPVYNEGQNIISVLEALRREVTSSYRILICYDHDEDDTLPVLHTYPLDGIDLRFVKNTGRGPHQAVMTGFQASVAPAVLVFPADDDYNAAIIDPMLAAFRKGRDIVCASRFMPGGEMVGCPMIKMLLLRAAAFTLRHVARVPTHDATNGFRLFSRRVLEEIEVESNLGFTFSLELLVKVHRLRWTVGENPAIWIERGEDQGSSKFKLLRWLPAYLRWYFYAFATTYLRRTPRTVSLRHPEPVDETAS